MLQQLVEEDNESSSGGGGDTKTGNSTILMSRSLGDNKPIHHIIQPTFFRGETPDTILSLNPWYPDINVYCPTCKQYLFVGDLPKHREYHIHLNAFGFKETDILSVEMLVKKRKVHINRIRRTAAITDKLAEFQQIDKLYDAIMKSVRSDTHNSKFPIQPKHVPIEEVFSKALKCSVSACAGVGLATSVNSVWRQSMEDRCVYQDFFGNHRSKAYFGVFDGYNGPFAAQLASEELHHSLLCDMMRFDPLTTCCCAYNMASDTHTKEHKEIHRPNTTRSSRVALHMASTNIVQSILHSCEERLDSKADHAALERLPTTSSLRQNSSDTDDSSSPHKPPSHPLVANSNTKHEDGDDIYSEKMADVFRKAFFYTDQLLMRGRNETASVRWSGCSATTAILRDSLEEPNSRPSTVVEMNEVEEGTADKAKEEVARLYLANVGLCRGILMRDNLAYRVTEEHSTRRKPERQRVMQAGGQLSRPKEDVLLNGIFAHTRALGSHGDADIKRCLISDPHTVSIPLDNRCQAVVLATGGLWSVLNEAEVAGIVATELPCNFANPLYYNEDVDELFDEPSHSSGSSSDEEVDEDIEEEIVSSNSSILDNKTGTVSKSLIGDESRATSRPPKSLLESDIQRPSKSGRATKWGVGSTRANTTFISSASRPETCNPPGWGSCLAEDISKKLVQAALLAGSRENISVLVLLLNSAVTPPPMLDDLYPPPRDNEEDDENYRDSFHDSSVENKDD